MKRLTPFLLLVSGLFVVCTTPPVAVEEPQPEAVVAEVPVPHGGAVSQEVYDATLAEVKGFIDGLNQSITRRNFSEWRGALTDEHFAQISSPEFLAQASESPALRRGRIVLRTANDYFTNVVVPSRANSQVDEIEIEGNVVKAYYLETRNTRGENNEVIAETRRLRLYELVKIDGNWKISN
jgi:hypothetical protein